MTNKKTTTSNLAEEDAEDGGARRGGREGPDRCCYRRIQRPGQSDVARDADKRNSKHTEHVNKQTRQICVVLENTKKNKTIKIHKKKKKKK